jgi:hypothetical protein
MEGSVVPKRVGKKPTKPAVPSTVTTPPSWPAEVLAFLKGRQERGALADCALPELFGEARRCAPTLTIGQFHDGLRALHQHDLIYLHPWTGPLYELPEPTLALLVGHEVSYYASVRAA